MNACSLEIATISEAEVIDSTAGNKLSKVKLGRTQLTLGVMGRRRAYRDGRRNLGSPIGASRIEVSWLQMRKNHESQENTYWVAESVVVAKKRVTIVEQRAGR